ncbi:MAG: cysteine synthase family protein [Bacteroidales bacterium]|nr:cysteine synthase family protein [Bacteroidales bacterium]
MKIKGLKPLYNSLLEGIGNTPLVRLNHLSDEFNCEVYGKIESFNPSMSIKDRVVNYIIDKAEKEGRLKPGMTIVDATSGNTGLSIALVALIKGYKCILTVKDSSAAEKITQLQLYGARVIKCPAKAKPEDPLSYYSMAQKIVDETPNAFFLDQNHNDNHFQAHYHSTGTELWQQSDGRITHFFSSASTGGTVSGVGTYLKEKNPNIRIICADSKGSVLKPFHEDGKYYKELKKQTPLEGVGKDIIPSVFRSSIINECMEIDNEDSIQCAKDLLREEGIFAGGSSGAAVDAFKKYMAKYPNEKVGMVVLSFPDHGIKYMAKLYKSGIKSEDAADLL